MTPTTTNTHSSRDLARELGETLPAALLLLFMTGSVVWALSVSSWAQGLEVLRPIAFLGLVVGVIFARLTWLPAWLAHLLSSALALTWTVQLLGGLMDERLVTWRDQATELIIRGVVWGRVLASGGRGEDILLFVLALCLLCWMLAYSTAWQVLRLRRAWRPIVLNAVVALVNYTYVLPKPTLAFFVFLCAALLLLVYQHVLLRQAMWDAQRIEYPDLLPVRFLWSAALVCGVLITLTAVLPGQVSVDRATRTWELLSSPFKAAREGWEDMFSTISAPPGAGSGAFTSRGASLGGARELGSDLVMTVRSTEYDYWRVVAFDKYTGQGWQNTTGEQARAALGVSTPEQARTPRSPGEPIPVSDVGGRAPIVQTFTPAEDRLDDLVAVGGTIISTTIPVLIEHNYFVDATRRRPNFDDTALVVAGERLRAGEAYSVTALMSFADVTSLQAAGTNYPAWVQERYLQLPATITARTREQAAQVIAEANAGTPYDQAIAIQAYLRSFPYNESIPAPPGSVDTVDWFLFEQREGYCDYFASAMVVMLRSQGVPARWVRGYAGGEFDTTRGVYLVRENVAHSWPEVYFPGFGWERFEPTPASYTSLPLRPLTSNLGEDVGELDDGLIPEAVPPNFDEAVDPEFDQVSTPQVLEPTEVGGGLSRPLAIAGAIAGLLALVAGASYGRWRYELRGLSQAGAAYAGMTLLAGWSGLGQEPHRTPLEYAERLGAALPAHRATIRRIAGAYEHEQYGGPTAAPGRLFSRRRANLPDTEEMQALRRALLQRIFTARVRRREGLEHEAREV